ncbi:putative bifunctional diguanylate cyclase/phosphodiesterase [Massilia antarctica]|uniref:putative bifunctional diguanylate cyclase/phosphodiesterase n=1 Tax=Massilia antarctica TaxID=2765360 RepID=UPI0006BDACCB|nr:EAL domain-containing protein [Massilia sp. H27-R4]MCY0910657.1 EAL domain-containing protein [Massilia sp. H27-R4]CUI08974.1 diguanylate cyclase/phosphodiesterase (GGDEF & EAL domains) with PAS/PAC sensor(s) [Janthinobacterium sp. CG23_2]CUU32760.1 diguanylate cyclase/phosphodiesterase (GGDEF & EAL domains) with PAS/PAC sensor(s) [Janthinobacterium sp. CG23_2]
MNQPAPRNEARIARFIRTHMPDILRNWDNFARSIPAARHLSAATLRDHAAGMLNAIADSLDLPAAAGGTPPPEPGTQAGLHGSARMGAGFSANDTVAEFRALRASVMLLWAASDHGRDLSGEDMMRFNDAVDQALEESLQAFFTEKDELAHRFDTLLSATPDLHYITDVDGLVLYANKVLAKLLGPPASPAVRQHLADFAPAFAAQVRRDLRAVADTRATGRGELACTLADGTAHTYRYILLPVINQDGTVDAITGTARNISELKASEAQILRNAYYDSLTGLPNRILFRERLEQDVRRAARTEFALALLFIDLDGFKEVNDRFGHDAGDLLLRQVAQRLQACVRATDTVARIGGDEFTVILNEVNRIAFVEVLVCQILAELARPFAIAGKEVHVSASIGITVCPQDAQLPDDLLRNADQAMFVAKHAGRNRFSYFTPDIRDSAWARLQAIDQLRQALAQRELRVYYQPIVELATGAIVKAEALVRWHHPDGSLVLPQHFIGIAEETGLIGEIDAWVLAQAVPCAARLGELTGKPFQISVNKSPVGFMSRVIRHCWDEDMALFDRAGARIALEITEGVLLDDSPGVRDKLARLQKAGVQFTIDDFGIGYSSMAYLNKFKVDFLKIDQSFVKDMLTTNPRSQIFAETIIVMAHKLGLKVIAEGVETASQRDWLRQAGCDYAQGFLFSPATTEERFTQLLQAG